MLEGLVQGLSTPPVVDGLELVEIANQNPPQTTEGQLGQLRPAGEINHRNFINHYPAAGVLPAADGFVGKVVDGEPAYVVGCQVSLGEDRHPFFALVAQELDKLSREV